MAPRCQTSDWQREMAQAFPDLAGLLDYLELDPSQVDALAPKPGEFGLRVPRPFAALIEKGNPDDPLLRQVLPGKMELAPGAGFVRDPVGDLQTQVAPGLLHKYFGRVLLIASAACGINCRYCFRRHYPYADALAQRNDWQPALDYIARNREISEVILSGGDPLSLSDQKLDQLITRLEQIPHVTRLRIHSRLPVVIPSRITDQLQRRLGGSTLDCILVVHINHANEISPELEQGVKLLKAAGVTLLNQSVLLAGVNDHATALCQLSEQLFGAGIMPYYLHQLDRVQGAAHFEVPIDKALSLKRQLAERLPGYLVPRLVREISGEPFKCPVGECP